MSFFLWGRRSSSWPLLLGVASLLVLRNSVHAATPVALSGRAMGTGWSVKFLQPDPAIIPADVERAVADRLEHLEQIFSTYRPQSELSRFNAVRHTEWFPVAPELAQVADESRKISALTGGAFDVTVQPLVELWGFGSQRRFGTIPGVNEVGAARALIDWRQLEVRSAPPALRKLRPAISADFSSMAKGFAADAVSELLVRRGAVNHLVQVGGDIKSGGTAASGAGWPTAIEQPVDEARTIAAIVLLTGEALSTSGDTRNFFRVGDRRYGHIIDPRTGRPSTHGLASVSVVHASCATSSALATALFVLGPDDGFRLATAQRLPCLFLVRDGPGLVRRATPEFERLAR